MVSRTIVSLVVVLALTAAGCKDEPAAKVAGKPDAEKKFQKFGKGVADTEDLTPIAKIVESPADFDGKEVTVKGVIASVCPHSGCFLHLGAGTQQIKVDLLEHGFTIPPGENGGHVAYAAGTVRVSGDQVKIAASGLHIMEK